MNKKNHDNIIDFVYSHCPASDIVGIMLTGSHADHTESNNSDIDIIVISMISSRQTHENIIERGSMYQLIIFPYTKLESFLYEDYITQKGVFFRMFTKGIILLDTNGVLQKLQKTLCNHAIPANNEQDILRLRRLITNEIEYIIGNDETNKFCSVLETIRMTAKLITGRYQTSGKHMDRLLNTHKDEQHLLQQALTTYMINKNGKQFVDTILLFLQPFGGIVEKYTTGYLFNVPHEKYLLVYLPACTMKDEATRKAVQDILTYCEPSCYCMTFYIGQNQLMEKGIYMFFYSETVPIKTLCDTLDKIRNIRLKNSGLNHINISFPYQSCFYEGGYFGGMKTFQRLIPLFSRISAIYMETYKLYEPDTQQNYQRALSVKTLYYYINSAFVDTQRQKSFLLECVRHFIPDATDTNGIYNLNQLEDVKEQVLHLHYEMYGVDKMNLHKMIQQEDSTTRKIKMSVENICYTICKSYDQNEVPIHIFYTTSKYTLHFHTISHLLSMYQLAPCEKFSLIYYLFKLSNENAI